MIFPLARFLDDVSQPHSKSITGTFAEITIKKQQQKNPLCFLPISCDERGTSSPPPFHRLSKLEAGELTCLLVRAATELQIGAVLRGTFIKALRVDERMRGASILTRALAGEAGRWLLVSAERKENQSKKKSQTGGLQMALVVFIFTVGPPAPRVTVCDGLPFVVVEVNGETAGCSFVAVTRLLPVTPAFPKMTARRRFQMCPP